MKVRLGSLTVDDIIKINKQHEENSICQNTCNGDWKGGCYNTCSLQTIICLGQQSESSKELTFELNPGIRKNDKK